MKRFVYPLGCLLLLLTLTTTSSAAVRKNIRIGPFWDYVSSTAHQGNPEGAWMYYYYNEFRTCAFFNSSVHLGAIDWTDPATSTTYDYWFAGAGHNGPDEVYNFMPLEDEEGNTIKKYWRYEPPTVIVDGLQISTPVTILGDEIAPDKIPGNADVMVVSTINTMMGVQIKQRVLAWSQQNHDDYHIYDYTFINNGNLDTDDTVETQQTINDFIVSKETQFGHTWRSNEWWCSAYGQRLDEDPDSLRIQYAYPARSSSIFDNMGSVNYQWVGGRRPSGPYMVRPWSMGDAYIFVSEGPDAYDTDDKGQPFMTDVHDQDLTWDKPDALSMSETDRAILYGALTESFLGLPGSAGGAGGPLIPQGELNADAQGGYHGLRVDEQPIDYSNELSWWTARHVSFSTVGPYDLDYGDSIRVVIARGMGSISPQMGYEVGMAWARGYNGEPGTDATDLWTEADYKLPPRVEANPDLLAPTDNDKAKDSWIMTSVDSLFQNLYNAQWNFQNNYTVPAWPRAPSLTVTSGGNEIHLEWGDEAESDNTLAGYRIYRALGNAGPIFPGSEAEAGALLTGSWELLTTVAKGTLEYSDTEANRGQEYYYAVTAYDNGVGNADVTDLGGNPVYPADQVLESSIYLNRTTLPASLLRPPLTHLDSIRVVPNPFNYTAGDADLQYIDAPNKILFLNLPPECTIRIFSGSGDLIKTIEHTNRSGDEAWGLYEQEHMTSSTGQIIVSGVYIAYIETPEGESTYVKFAIVR